MIQNEPLPNIWLSCSKYITDLATVLLFCSIFFNLLFWIIIPESTPSDGHFQRFVLFKKYPVQVLIISIIKALGMEK